MATIGIDLGTTNSCAATVEGGRPAIIVNAEGERTTPSVVAFSKDGERLVGSIASRQASVNPNRTIASVKRRMGSDWRATIDGKAFAPQELSAMILRKLRRDAEAFLGQDVTDAVITVPAYFDDAHGRRARLRAGQRHAAEGDGVRLGRRYVRCVHHRDRRRRHRGAGHIRRQPPGRR